MPATLTARKVYATAAWRRIRPLVLARDGHRCKLNLPCCIGHATTVDHIIELDQGGDPFDPANLRAACRPCNGSKGASYVNRKREPRSEDPYR